MKRIDRYVLCLLFALVSLLGAYTAQAGLTALERVNLRTTASTYENCVKNEGFHECLEEADRAMGAYVEAYAKSPDNKEIEKFISGIAEVAFKEAKASLDTALRARPAETSLDNGQKAKDILLILSKYYGEDDDVKYLFLKTNRIIFFNSFSMLLALNTEYQQDMVKVGQEISDISNEKMIGDMAKWGDVLSLMDDTLTESLLSRNSKLNTFPELVELKASLYSMAAIRPISLLPTCPKTKAALQALEDSIVASVNGSATDVLKSGKTADGLMAKGAYVEATDTLKALDGLESKLKAYKTVDFAALSSRIDVAQIDKAIALTRTVDEKIQLAANKKKQQDAALAKEESRKIAVDRKNKKANDNAQHADIAKVEKKASGKRMSSCSKRVGPKVKGFRLGAPLDDAVKVLNKNHMLYGEPVHEVRMFGGFSCRDHSAKYIAESKELPVAPIDIEIADSNCKFHYENYFITDGKVYPTPLYSWSINGDENGCISEVEFGSYLVEKLFQVADLDGRAYAELFVDGYNIPRMEGKYSEGGLNFVGDYIKGKVYWEHTNPKGWTVVITEDKTTILKRVPSKAERRFD